MRKLASILLLSMTLGISAKADIVVNRIGDVTPEGSNYRWTYEAVLDEHPLNATDFFIIFDFVGYVPGGDSGPASWGLTVEDSSVQTDTAVPDMPGVSNLRWVYSGATVPLPTGGGTPQLTFSPFSSLSSVGPSGIGNLYFVGQTSGGQAGNLGQVQGPGNGSEVPEPGSMMLLGGGLGAMVFALRRRRQA